MPPAIAIFLGALVIALIVAALYEQKLRNDAYREGRARYKVMREQDAAMRERIEKCKREIREREG